MPHLTTVEKMQIVTLLDEGWSSRRLSARFRVTKSTILNIKNKWQQQGTVERNRGSGRKPVSNPVQNENIIEFLRNNPFSTVVNARSITQFPGCIRTARNRIRNNSNLTNRVAVKKPFLTDMNRQQRIGFALQLLPNDLNFWENVIFSDEKVFQSCNNGHIRVYRPPNSRFIERYTQKACRSGRFSTNIWAWINARGPGVC